MSKIEDYTFQSDIDGFIENDEPCTIFFEDGSEAKINWDTIKERIIEKGLNEVCFDTCDHNGEHIQEEFTLTPEQCFMEDTFGILKLVML